MNLQCGCYMMIRMHGNRLREIWGHNFWVRGRNPQLYVFCLLDMDRPTARRRAVRPPSRYLRRDFFADHNIRRSHNCCRHRLGNCRRVWLSRPARSHADEGGRANKFALPEPTFKGNRAGALSKRAGATDRWRHTTSDGGIML